MSGNLMIQWKIWIVLWYYQNSNYSCSVLPPLVRRYTAAVCASRWALLQYSIYPPVAAVSTMLQMIGIFWQQGYSLALRRHRAASCVYSLQPGLILRRFSPRSFAACPPFSFHLCTVCFDRCKPSHVLTLRNAAVWYEQCDHFMCSGSWIH